MYLPSLSQTAFSLPVFFRCAEISLKSLITDHHEVSLKRVILQGFPLFFPSCFLDGYYRKSYFSSFSFYQVYFLLHREPATLSQTLQQKNISNYVCRMLCTLLLFNQSKNTPSQLFIGVAHVCSNSSPHILLLKLGIGTYAIPASDGVCLFSYLTGQGDVLHSCFLTPMYYL